MFTIGLLLVVVCMMVILSSMIILPLYLQTSLALSSLAAGLLLLPGGIINGFLLPIIGDLFDRFGPKWLVTPGLVLVTAALYGFSTISLQTSSVFIVAMHIMMIGISMVMMPAQTNGLNQLPQKMYPDGSAIVNTLHQVSGAIGMVVVITILTSSSNSYMENVSEQKDPLQSLVAFTSGVQVAFWFAIIVAFIGLIISFFVKRVKEENTNVG